MGQHLARLDILQQHEVQREHAPQAKASERQQHPFAFSCFEHANHEPYASRSPVLAKTTSNRLLNRQLTPPVTARQDFKVKDRVALTVTRQAFGPDPPTMQFDQFPADRQSQASTAC